jgi:hypothetical protein
LEVSNYPKSANAAVIKGDTVRLRLIEELLGTGSELDSCLHAMITRNEPAARDGAAPKIVGFGSENRKNHLLRASLACTFTQMGFLAQLVHCQIWVHCQICPENIFIHVPAKPSV